MSSSSRSSQTGSPDSKAYEFPPHSATSTIHLPPHTIPHVPENYGHDLFSPIMPMHDDLQRERRKYHNAPRSSWPPVRPHGGVPSWAATQPAPPHQLPVEETPRPGRHSYPPPPSAYGHPGEDYAHPASYGAWQAEHQPPPHGYPHFPPHPYSSSPHAQYYSYHQPSAASQPSPKPRTSNHPHPVGPILEPGEELAPRPPFTFAALIGQALLEAPPPHQLYVSEISDSIKKRYPYYRQHPNKIYNGVRHQTSMCKAFIKLPRPFGDQSGGARKWTIRPGCESWFAGGGYHPPAEGELSGTKSKSGKNRSSASVAASMPRIKMPVLRLNVGLSRNSELSPPPEHAALHAKSEAHPCAPNGAPLLNPHTQTSPGAPDASYTPAPQYHPHPVVAEHVNAPQIPPFPQEYMMQPPPLGSYAPYPYPYPYPYPGHHYAPYPYVDDGDAMAPPHGQWSFPQPPPMSLLRVVGEKQEPAKTAIEFSVQTGTPSPRSSGHTSPHVQRKDAMA